MNGVDKKQFTYFSYDVSNCKGYRLIVEKSNLKSFKNFTYDGFDILYLADFNITFKIENKLIRKLKLLKLNNKIRKASKEDHIFELLEKSEKKTPDAIDNYTWYNYNNSYVWLDEAVENRKYYKQQNKYQNYQYKNKIRNYSKYK